MDISSKRDIARQLRRNQTLAEQKMWWLLRSRAFIGFKFCRQFPVGPFVADFCCRKRKLIIELDGGHHADNEEYDRERTIYLEQHGYRVLRFWNRDFLNNQKVVLKAILMNLAKSPHPRYTRPLPTNAGRGQTFLGLAFSRGHAGEGGRRPDEG